MKTAGQKLFEHIQRTKPRQFALIGWDFLSQATKDAYELESGGHFIFANPNRLKNGVNTHSTGYV